MWGLRSVLVALLAAALVLPGGFQARAQDGLAYTTRVVGLGEDVADRAAMAEALRASSNLVQLEGEAPPRPAALIRRAAIDVEQLRGVLRSFGYYDGRVAVRLDGQAHDSPGISAVLAERLASGGRVEATLEPQLGTRYTITQTSLIWPPDLDDFPDVENPLATGAPARAETVLNAEARLLAALRAAGHPFADVERDVAIRPADQAMIVNFLVAPGPLTHLAPVEVTGLNRVEEPYLRRLAGLEAGQRYSPTLLDRARSDMIESGLFSGVEVEIGSEVDEDGRLPVTISVQERPPRFVGVGASFETGRGLSLNAFWGHRNLLGRAEQIRVDLEFDRLLADTTEDIEARLATSFTKPNFLRNDQTLVAETALIRETTDRFERLAGTVGATLERPIGTDLIGALGTRFELSSIEEEGEEDRFALFGVPVGLRQDTTDDLLDPKTGHRWQLRAEPTLGLLSGSAIQLKLEGRGSLYRALDEEERIVLATRLALGSLLARSTDAIAADRRFFAGGGGSVRGYEFETIGPLDADDDPIGGRSLFEAAVELRWRAWGSFGIVPFIDVGGVFTDTWPSFERDLRIGAGLGVRYHTQFGPLRLDVGVPVNPRERDPAFQLYLSIGQAF